MMKMYVNNYWSLYVEFIHDFNSLKYRGYTLSYIFQFPTLIRHNQKIWKEFNDDNFQNRLKTNIQHEKEVQGIFDAYIHKHKRNTYVKHKNGKVLIFEDNILRFPEKTFDQYFDRSKTLILLRNDELTEKYNIPIVNLNDYTRERKQAITKLQAEAKLIFQHHHNHHLYSDKTFQAVLLRKIADVVKCMEECSLLLEDIAVSCIVVSGSQSFISRILSFIAAKKGIPTICMQHGIIANGFGYLPKICSVNAVYGKFEVDWYASRGVSRDTLAVIGHPRFDQAFQFRSISRLKFHKELDIDHGKKTLLIAVRGNRDLIKWRMFLNTISKNIDVDHVNILIRDFPSTEPHLLTKEFSFVQSTQAMSLYDVLTNVDCVISYPSTVGLEAMLLNKATFILKKRIPNDTEYFDHLDPFIQKDPNKLAEMVVEYLTFSTVRKNQSKTRKAFLELAYPDKSKSGDRLIKLIHQLTKN